MLPHHQPMRELCTSWPLTLWPPPPISWLLKMLYRPFGELEAFQGVSHLLSLHGLTISLSLLQTPTFQFVWPHCVWGMWTCVNMATPLLGCPLSQLLDFCPGSVLGALFSLFMLILLVTSPLLLTLSSTYMLLTPMSRSPVLPSLLNPDFYIQFSLGLGFPTVISNLCPEWLLDPLLQNLLLLLFSYLSK